jgi:hypothetical protein
VAKKEIFGWISFIKNQQIENTNQAKPGHGCLRLRAAHPAETNLQTSCRQGNKTKTTIEKQPKWPTQTNYKSTTINKHQNIPNFSLIADFLKQPKATNFHENLQWVVEGEIENGFKT